QTTEPAGKIRSQVDAAGRETTFTYGSNGQLATIFRSATVGSNRVDEAFVYSYLPSGVNAGLLKSVRLQRREGTVSPSTTGSWGTVRKVSYAYYGASDAHGNIGDLKTATVKDADGNVIDTMY